MNEQSQETNRRILIIDDNQAIHDDFRKILAPLDAGRSAELDASEAELFGEPVPQASRVVFELDSAYQGQEAVAMLEKSLAEGRPYAMAFVDVRMPPGWDGVETTRRMLELDPRLQIVICTAYADYSWDDIFASIGERDGLLILKKPFDTIEALQLAYAFTEKWRLHRESQSKMQDLEARVEERTAEIRRANQALRESEERFSRAFEYAAAGMALVAPDGRWLKVNRALCELFGYSAEEFDREVWELIVDPAHSDNDVEGRRRLLEGKAPVYHVQKRCRDRSGRTVWVMLSVALVREGDEPLYFIWQLQDITKRKLAEQQLSLEYSVSRVMAESVGEDQVGPKIIEVLCQEFDWNAGVLWQVTQRSDALRRTAAWPEPDLSGDGFAGKGAGVSFSGAEGIPTQVWSSGEAVWAPDLSAAGDSEDVAVALESGFRAAFAFPVMIENRVAGAIVLYSREHRELDEDLRRILVVLGGQLGQFFQRRALEDKLFQTEKLKTVGKLAGGVAHEFNSVLTAIIGRSEMILTDLAEDSRPYSNAIEIRKAAERAAVLTRQLLAYGRKQFLRLERLDLNRVIVDMGGILGPLLGSHIDIRLNPGAELAKVEADVGQIEEVIMNLALNAGDAMPGGGKLTLETANVSLDADSIGRDEDLKPGSYVMLAVSDTGIGMTPEVRERGFEPFFTTKEVGKGSGLGLATCYGIVKQSGGQITLYSEPGRGTTVKIYLPKAPAPASAEKGADAAVSAVVSLPRGKESILLVEDDPGLRDMAAALLRRLGYSVVTATNGADALALSRESEAGQFDLLFTDVVMPEVDGVKLAERIRGSHPSVRILFTSAYTERAIDHRGLVATGADILEKPFTPSALARKVREVLERASPTDPREANQK